MKPPRGANKQMVVILYGKGGVGKTTVSSHLAAHYAKTGKKVLLVGCDPKADTSTRLLSGRKPPTMVEAVEGKVDKRFASLLMRTGSGVDVIETGGPEPGVGCGGRGVATLCRFLEEHSLELSAYDIIIFDVLGDLVCGGFVAPLRFGTGNCVFIVTSEEPASLLAANNIARVAGRPFQYPVSVGGLIFNLRGRNTPRGGLKAFAKRLNVGIIGYLERDKAIMAAEEKGLTAITHAPKSKAAAAFAGLSKKMEKQVRARAARNATPLENDAFWEFIAKNRMRSL